MITRSNNRMLSILLALYFASIPFNSIAIPGLGSIYKYIVVIIAGVYSVSLLQEGGILRLTPTIKIWFVFTLYTIFALMISTNSSFSKSYTLGMIEIFVVTAILQGFRYDESICEIIYKGIVLSGIIYLFFMLRYSEAQIYTSRGLISFGQYGGMDPNEFCGYLIAPALIGVKWLFEKKKILYRLLITIFELLIVYSVLISGSRGGLIALIVGVLVIVFYNLKSSIRTIVFTTFMIIIGLIVFYYFIIPNVPESILARFTLANIKSNGGSGRSEVWIDAFNYLKNNPFRLFFGCGIFGAVDLAYCTHNQYIQVLLDTGIMGFTIYIFMLQKIYSAAKRKGIFEVSCFVSVQVLLLTLSAYAWFKASWLIYLLCILPYETTHELQE